LLLLLLSLFAIRYSLFAIRFSLFAFRFSLFAFRYSLFKLSSFAAGGGPAFSFLSFYFLLWLLLWLLSLLFLVVIPHDLLFVLLSEAESTA